MSNSVARVIAAIFIFGMLFLAWTTNGAALAEPKFHFQDCVSVTSGFYRNCFGFVISISRANSYEAYMVRLTCNSYGNVYETLKAEELKLSNSCKKDN